MQSWVIVVLAIAYVTMLFAIANAGDRKSARHGGGNPRPLIYALSLAIYCTSWTFFGSVGVAAERGFEFLAIYAGPILAFVFGYPLLQRIIRLSKTERITSIADFLASRYGKNFSVASTATIIAIIGSVPYIALQLKSISGSVQLMVAHYAPTSGMENAFFGDISLIVAVLLAVFAVLFGTRHADATEHQDGLVLAVAVESVVKLAAFLAVGIAVTFYLFGNVSEFVAAVSANSDVRSAGAYQTSLATWLVLTALSGIAIVMLPRQFYVSIVENRSDKELRTARWLFPAYLAAINLFVVPIAFAGLAFVGEGVSADLYVLALPLKQGNEFLALFAFIGGLSAATAMVIVECVALAIMVSNDLVIPLFIRRLLRPDVGENEDWSRTILTIRRGAIFIILLAAFLYYRETADNTRLASIGLLSFAAIAQFAPAFFGGLFWRGANARGAVFGMMAGISIWAYTLLLPTIAPADAAIFIDGPFGISALRPQALFGIDALALNHGVFVSLFVNTMVFVFMSLTRAASHTERMQAALFVPREASPIPAIKQSRANVTVDELKDTVARYLGAERAERAFQRFELSEGRRFRPGDRTNDALARFAEQLLASAVGSSSARLILSLLFQKGGRNAREAIRLLDDASVALQQNRGLLQTALDQIEQGISVLDPDERLSCWNRRFGMMFDVSDDLGQVGVPLIRIISTLAERNEIDPRSEEDVMRRLRAMSDPIRLELQKSRRTLEITSNPMPDGGMVVTWADISAQVASDHALKRANETLEQRVIDRTGELLRVNEELIQAQMLAEEANIGKTRFLAAAGHDILQPLNAARLYCSSLSETIADGPVAESVEKINSSLDSVEMILGEVLEISSLDTGGLKPAPSVFRLDTLLEQIATDFRPQAAGKKLRLRIVPTSASVETDRNLLRRLIQNLVSNAVKYTRKGSVLVGVRRRGEMTEIQVVDSGIGMPGDKLNAVFGEFTRLDEGAREAPGLGLGLSIVDRIARVLRLEIRIWSEPGKGTVFSVILPTARAAPAHLAEVPQPVAVDSRLDGLRVLCVDNDPRILDGMRRLLENWGCAVETASGTADLAQPKAVAVKQPDIMLVDYHLGGETGFAAIASLRRRFGTHVPALLVTADRSSEVRAAASKNDIPVINKPVKPAALRAALNRHRRIIHADDQFAG